MVAGRVLCLKVRLDIQQPYVVELLLIWEVTKENSGALLPMNTCPNSATYVA